LLRVFCSTFVVVVAIVVVALIGVVVDVWLATEDTFKLIVAVPKSSKR
jgi:hypothetical protein